MREPVPRMKSPAMVDLLVSHSVLMLLFPLLVSAWSKMSSCTRLAVWIISATMATSLCWVMVSLSRPWW